MTTQSSRKQSIGDGDAFELDGLTFKVEHVRDDAMGEPWKEHDGHGIVSEWTTRDKRPGEKVLAQDRERRRYYDVQGTLEIAMKDGWGVSAVDTTGMSKRQIAALAVERDFDYLKRWCDDDWYWIGVCVELLDVEGNPVPHADARESLFGIESDSGDYLSEVARELAEDIAARFEGKEAIETRIRK